jgi:hypothetical protein
MKAKNSGLDGLLMRLWRLAVLGRAGYRCEMCGSADVVEAHHVIGKRYLWTRYEPANGVAACRVCHDKPYLIRRWLAAHRPRRWSWIRRQERLVRPNRLFNYKKMLRKLEAA